MVTKVIRKIVRKISGRELKQEEFLLDRLGGMVVLSSIVNEFCRRATTDERLGVFFQDVDVELLVAHQQRFFALAFTHIDKRKAETTILESHARLFSVGLNENHFDIVFHHLTQTLQDRGFRDNIVAEVAAVIRPLRSIFQKGARIEKGTTGRGGVVAALKQGAYDLFRGTSARNVQQHAVAA